MTNSAALLRNEVTPEMAELLHAGAADGRGLVCRPGQIRKNYATLRAAEKLGYLRFLDLDRPWITEEGRAAIGAPSQAAADRARAALLLAPFRKRLVPEKRDDPRTDFDYRSYQTMKFVCVIVIKLPDDRQNPPSLKVGRIGVPSEPHYLGSKNSILMPESEGRFVLALIPDWLQQRTKLPTYGLALDEGPEFTDEEREIWERLRKVCSSINSRIRNANRRKPERLRFGEFA